MLGRFGLSLFSVARVSLELGFGGLNGVQVEVKGAHVVPKSICAGEELLALDNLLAHHLKGGVEDNGLAATLAFHAWDDIGEAVEAASNGLATLLLGADVVLLFLGFRQARPVWLVGRAWRGARHGGRGRGGGGGFDADGDGVMFRGRGWEWSVGRWDKAGRVTSSSRDARRLDLTQKRTAEVHVGVCVNESVVAMANELLSLLLWMTGAARGGGM